MSSFINLRIICNAFERSRFCDFLVFKERIASLQRFNHWHSARFVLALGLESFYGETFSRGCKSPKLLGLESDSE